MDAINWMWIAEIVVVVSALYTGVGTGLAIFTFNRLTKESSGEIDAMRDTYAVAALLFLTFWPIFLIAIIALKASEALAKNRFFSSL